MGKEVLKTAKLDTDPVTLPELHDDFMTNTALLNMVEFGCHKWKRLKFLVDATLDAALETEPRYGWSAPEGYWDRITANCEKPKYVNTQKKGLLK